MLRARNELRGAAISAESTWGERMDLNPQGANTPVEQTIRISPGPRFLFALVLAIVADGLQLAIIPLFIAGAESPVADVVDLAMAAVLYFLLGWHWEFLPSIAGKLIPGVDLIPLWTLAVANVYRRAKRAVVTTGANE
jgi:hypothetical protein